MKKGEMKNQKRSKRPKVKLLRKICTKCSTLTGYSHDYMKKGTKVKKVQK